MSMRDIDREMMDRFAESNPFGYQPHSRDADGNAIFIAENVPSGRSGDIRTCYLKVTPKGLLYDEVRTRNDAAAAS